jgi:TRAP-type C4-dicarboxylate transport system permease small subunit
MAALYPRAFALAERAAGALERVVTAVGVVLLALVVGLKSIDIVTRNLLAFSWLGPGELSLFAAAALYFIGYAALIKRREDVAVEYFHDRLPRRVRRVAEVLIAGAGALFFAIVTWKAVALFQLFGLMSHPVFDIPQSVIVVPILAGGAACLAMALFNLWDAIDRVARGRPDVAPRRVSADLD